LIQLHRRAQLLQPAGVEHGDAVPHRHRLHLVVGDVQGGGAELALQRRDLGAGEGLRFLERKWYALRKNE
jgi:hypothetical protein